MVAVSPDSAQAANQGWLARLQLGFSRRGEKSLLSRRKREGPLTLQRPFYPEGGVCHTYLLHPPGGVVGGDRLEIDVSVDGKAHALITTPGAGKFYRSAGDLARVRQRLTVADGGNLETVSMSLFRYYLLPFEVISILLLVALVGAVMLARARY